MKRILVSTLLAVIGFTAVFADVPLLINYQGRVTDSTGALIGAGTPVNRKIIFRIWDHASNSTGLLWTEEQTVTIYNGDFSVLLGAGIDATGTAASESRPALDTVFGADGTDRFLEIMVDDGNNTIEAGDQPISPRQQITSTGFAFRAKFADNVATGTDLNLNGSNNYGLGWYGTGRQFANISIDGPVLYGNAGGALGSYNGTTQTSALRWNAAGQVGVGSVDLAGMDATSKLILQGNDSSAPPKQLTIRGSTTTKRLYLGYNTTGNYGALQAYNGASTTTSLLLNPLGSTVAIGTTTPTSGAQLEINGTVSTSSINANIVNIPTTSSSSAGVIRQNGASLLHSKGTGNFFAGPDSGNFTLSGHSNTATGHQTLSSNTSGFANVANGFQALKNNTTGQWNTAVGNQAMLNNTTGRYCVALGQIALRDNTDGTFNTALGYSSLYKNTTGGENTAVGNYALGVNLTGNKNTSTGVYSLDANTTGNENTANGYGALGSNTTGHYNTGIGVRALRDCTTGQFNTALGREALASLTTVSETTAVGAYALANMTSGSRNTAVGYSALIANTTGHSNTSVGFEVLKTNTTGFYNTGLGYLAGNKNTTGNWNTALGYNAMGQNTTGSDNTAVGESSMYYTTTGGQNTAIGYFAGVSSAGGAFTNTTCVGYYAQATQSNMVRLGNTSVTVIQGQVGFTASSDRNLKENFVPVDGAEVIRKILKMPLTSWNFIGHDKTKFRHYGPMAQDFYAAFGKDSIGSIGTETTINSGDLGGILLSGVQELARKLEVKDTEVKALRKRLAELEAKDKARDAKLTAIEALLRSSAKPVGQTASLKSGAE